MSETLSPTEAKYFETRGEAEPSAPAPDAGTTSPASAPDTGGVAQKPAEPGQQQAPDQAPEPKFVDKRALDDERKQRRQLERENRELLERQAAADARNEERFRALQAMLQPVAKPQPQIPPFEQDPRAYFEAQNAILRQQVVEQGQTVQQFQAWQQAEMQRQQEAQRQSEFINRVTAYGQQNEAEFRKVSADYGEAAQHLRNLRIAQLRALPNPQTGLPMSDQEILQTVNNETLQIAAIAMQHGKDFAQTIYDLAIAAGYTKKQAQAAAAAQSGQPANPLAPVQKGQQLAGGLSTTGSAPPAKLDAQMVANMSEAQFAKLLETNAEELMALMQ